MIVRSHDDMRQIDSISRESLAGPVTQTRLIGNQMVTQLPRTLAFCGFIIIFVYYLNSETQHAQYVPSARVRIPLWHVWQPVASFSERGVRFLTTKA